MIARNVWRELASNIGAWTRWYLDRRAAVLTPGNPPVKTAVRSWMCRVQVLCNEHGEEGRDPWTDAVFGPWQKIIECQNETGRDENQSERETRTEEIVESCAGEVEEIAKDLTSGMNLERFEAGRQRAWWATRDTMHHNNVASTPVGLSGGLQRARMLDRMPRRYLRSIEMLNTWARVALFSDHTSGSIDPSVLKRPPEQWIRALIEEGARQAGVIAGRRPNARRIARTERCWRWGRRRQMAPPYAAILAVAETGKEIDDESGYGAALTLEKASAEHTAAMHREAIDLEAQSGQRRISDAIREKALENIARWAGERTPESTLEVLQRTWNEAVQRHGEPIWLGAKKGEGRVPYLDRVAGRRDAECNHWMVHCDTITRIFAAYDDIEEAAKDPKGSARLQITMGRNPVVKEILEKGERECPTWGLARQAMERTKAILGAREKGKRT